MDERSIEAAGIPTPILEGGEGPPVVLLHGPGVSGTAWLLTVPHLVNRCRVVVPDLPGHGSSGGPAVTEPELLDWLSAVIGDTCDRPPVIVGHLLGGAVAARFAAARGEEIAGLVLVDSLGLVRFQPAPGFVLAMLGFLRRPTERSFERMMRQCSWDLDGLRDDLADRWDPFVAQNLALASRSQEAGRMMRRFGLRRIPAERLARISAPTALVWGREDRSNRVGRARKLGERLGWPLHVIEECGDDPPLDRPAELAAIVSRYRSSGRPSDPPGSP